MTTFEPQLDPLDTLPTQPSSADLKLSRLFFETEPVKETHEQAKHVHSITGFFQPFLWQDMKPYIIVGLVFFLLSMPFFSQCIQDNIPYTRQSELAFLSMKTLLFITLLYIILHLKDAQI